MKQLKALTTTQRMLTVAFYFAALVLVVSSFGKFGADAGTIILVLTVMIAAGLPYVIGQRTTSGVR